MFEYYILDYQSNILFVLPMTRKPVEGTLYKLVRVHIFRSRYLNRQNTYSFTIDI